MSLKDICNIRQDGRVKLRPGLLHTDKVAITLEKEAILVIPCGEDPPPAGALIRRYDTKYNLVMIPRVFLRVADEYADKVIVTYREDGVVVLSPVKNHCAFCGKEKNAEECLILYGKKICTGCMMKLEKKRKVGRI